MNTGVIEIKFVRQGEAGGNGKVVYTGVIRDIAAFNFAQIRQHLERNGAGMDDFRGWRWLSRPAMLSRSQLLRFRKQRERQYI